MKRKEKTFTVQAIIDRAINKLFVPSRRKERAKQQLSVTQEFQDQGRTSCYYTDVKWSHVVFYGIKQSEINNRLQHRTIIVVDLFLQAT